MAFFATAEAFAAWPEQHGAAKSEFVVRYYKRTSKRRSASDRGDEIRFRKSKAAWRFLDAQPPNGGVYNRTLCVRRWLMIRRRELARGDVADGIIPLQITCFGASYLDLPVQR